MGASGGQQEYQNAVPQAGAAYASSGFQDDLVQAELFLGLATNSSDLINEASQRYIQNQLGGRGGVFNWDSKIPGLAVLFSQIASTRSDLAGNLTGWQTEAERYFDDIVGAKSASGAAVTDGKLDEFVFWDTLLKGRRFQVVYSGITATLTKRVSIPL